MGAAAVPVVPVSPPSRRQENFMHKSARLLVATAIAAGATLTSIGVAAAAPPARVTICHGTASESNPYEAITVSAASFKDGHFDDQTLPSHGANNHPDFILVEGSDCAAGPGGGGGGA
jgi:hypothetical protein